MFYLDTITIAGAITKLRDLDKVKDGTKTVGRSACGYSHT